MNNFAIQHEGKEYWISRSIAVACFVFANINNEWRVLANQRGTGAADFNGLWNVPCGYLDFDETTKEAAMREVYEETGVKIPEPFFWKFTDSPKENRQNVTFLYGVVLEKPKAGDVSLCIGDFGGEVNEVNSVAWIPVDKIHDFKWAFNHNHLIDELLDELSID